MLSLRNFWRRHKRKVYVTAGVLGSGYLLYKLYVAHKRRLADLEREMASELENRRSLDDLMNARMKAHFENIQRIADTTTLPHAIHQLSNRIGEELDLTHLRERLMQGKGQPNTLTSSEKLELWEKLKILSFTKMVVSLWAMTVLSLYIRVQVNILGRHMYIDTAYGLESSHIPDDGDLIDREDQEKFLASTDYLASQRLPAFISNMQVATTYVLQRKQLRDLFTTTTLRDAIMQILDLFMSTGSTQQWVDYLMSEDYGLINQTPFPSHESTIVPEFTKFDQLMVETRAVLLSAEFRNVVEVSLKIAVDLIMEDTESQLVGGSPTSGMPLAKLVPRVAQMSPILLEEPIKNRFLQTIYTIPEVELFFTLVYTNMPPS